MENIGKLSSMKIESLFLQDLIERSRNETDLQQVDVNVSLSALLERIAGQVKDIEETFEKTRSVMREYKETYEVKRSIGTAEKYENVLKSVFISFKASAERIGELIALSSLLMTKISDK